MDGGHDQRIRRIFDAVMDLPRERRQERIETECRGDPDLARRLEGMVRAAEGDFLSDPTRSRAATQAASHEAPGTRIGAYKLLQLVGEGGFGSVFMAEQERPVRRKVALKIIKLGMDTKQVIARFEAERQALALMDHPHIAKVLDAGATESGRPYFVMELVKGVPITEYCDSNNLSARERLELFIPVCQAVQHAHHKGVIHRDIKPGNILVTLHDGKPVPKVIDFGIAKATEARLTEKTLFTEHRQLIGTPAYMSPEQAEMSGLDVDTRTDVYSLGVLLYELLTGTTPFLNEDLMKAGYGEIQRIIREVEPPKPSTRVSTLGESLTAVAGRRRVDGVRLGLLLRGDLDWIVMRCLEKDRTRRYDTPTSLAEDVRRHLDGEAVVAAPPSVGYRVRKFVRRNRGGVATGIAVVAVLLMGTAGTSWGFVRASAKQKDLETLIAKLQDQAKRAEEGVGKMMSILTGGATKGPLIEWDKDGIRSSEQDPLGFAIGFGTDLAVSLKQERDSLSIEVRRARLAEAALLLGDRGEPATDVWSAFQTRQEYLGLGDSRTIKAIAAIGHELFHATDVDVWPSRCAEALDAYYGSGGLPNWSLIEAERKLAFWLGFHRRFESAEMRLEAMSEHIVAVNESEGWKGSLTSFSSTEWSPQLIDGPVLATPYPMIGDNSDVLAAYFRSLRGQALRDVLARQANWAARQFYIFPASAGNDIWLPMATLASDLMPDDPTILCTIAMAHYRLGEFSNAVGEAIRAEGIASARGTDSSPVLLAVLAMSQQRLDHAAEARAALANLRALMSDPANADTWATDEDAKALLAEAEALIDPRPSDDPPPSDKE